MKEREHETEDQIIPARILNEASNHILSVLWLVVRNEMSSSHHNHLRQSGEGSSIPSNLASHTPHLLLGLQESAPNPVQQQRRERRREELPFNSLPSNGANPSLVHQHSI